MFIRIHYLWWALALVLLNLSACKGLKNTSDTGSSTGWRAILEKTEAERIQFEDISISGKAILNIPEANVSGMSVQYRMSILRDSMIMIRVSKIVEVARILITRDSVLVLDKINKNFIACDFQLAEEYTGLDADFSLLQDLILGHFHPLPLKFTPDKKTANIQTFRGNYSGTDFAYSIDTKLHKVVTIEAKNTLKNQESQINYRDFETNGGTEIPMTTAISVSAPSNLSFEIQHKKVQVNSGDLSFVLGSTDSYERTGCK
ncbi:MAG: DUF4292 domain-containing protein [Bacteroidia bacterium]